MGTTMIETPRPSIEWVIAPVICWAGEQCGIPLIRSLAFTNPTDHDLPSARAVIQLIPDLGEPLWIHLPPLGVGASFRSDRVDYRLPAGRLRHVAELERAEFLLQIMQDNVLVAEQRLPVEVLPSNQWPGLRMPPGLITSFITPNHGTVAEILKKTSDRMFEVAGSAALLGYQAKNPNAVRAQVVALLRTLQSLGLSYIGMPASFETDGQKIRFPDRILREKMANCLDMTLLTTACLEQMGLRPLAIFIHGHAFPGVWLSEDRFPEGVVEDAARLRNLLALDQILVWDSSATLDQPPLSFAQLQQLGQRHLTEDDTFSFAVDVRVMRLERFLPLPLREATPEPSPEPLGAQTGPAGDAELADLVAAAAREGARLAPEPRVQPPQIVGRWQRWKDRLLDLSLRNRLLNFRPSGNSALPLEVPYLSRFEDLLADNRIFDLLPKPPLDSRDERDLKLLAQREDAQAWKAQRLVDLEGRIVHSSLTPGEFIKHAKSLESLARTDLEEGGVNTVFATLGLLRWFEPGNPTERFAPLLLYPVQILFNRQLRRVCLQRLVEDPIANVTLIEKMRRDFNVDLSFLASLEADDAGLDIPQMLRQCREAIQRMPRWEILEETHLGHFTFAKFLMWKDLEDNADVLMANPVIHHLASSEGSEWIHQPEAVPIDVLETMDPSHLPCVVDADSTQLSAVASALAGRSFVLQGPPGTGKSQTIANIIACALAHKRSVLFVSEKMAALEVVHARLRKAGLADFCLELHSHKANRKQVLESFQAVLLRDRGTLPAEWEARETELKELRSELNAYADALHRVHPIGFSLFEGNSRLLALASCRGITLRKRDLGGLEAEPYRQMLLTTDTFAHRARALEDGGAHPWTGTDPGAWSRIGQDALEDHLNDTREALTQVRECLEALGRDVTLPLSSAPEALEALNGLLKGLDAGPVPEAALDPATWTPLWEGVLGYQSACQALARRTDAIMARWLPALLEQDLSPLVASYDRHANAFPLVRWLLLWGAAGQLRPLSRTGLAGSQDVQRDLREALAIQAERHRLQEDALALSRGLKPAPWETRDALPARASGLQAHLDMLQLHGAPGSSLQLGRTLWRMPAERRQGHTKRLGAAWEGFRTRQMDLFQDLGLRIGQDPWGGSEDSHLDALARNLDLWQSGMPAFRAWCFYRESGRALEAVGLSEVVEAHRAGLRPEALAPATERALLERWCAAIRDLDPSLRGFEGSEHHRKVARFQEADQRWIALSRSFVIKQLEGRLPVAGTGISETSEMGILLRQLKMKTRHMAIRKLLQAIPSLLPRLKPCLLMSPLSVAQYLPAEGKPFDLLVFDEASQITTHDAIGALARGNQVVIVGDAKQLPPTSFFTRNMDDETQGDDNDVMDLESILDEATAKQFPQQLLGWHYRSRHHALIEFSNLHYYEDRLHVFPAAMWRAEDLGIRWHPVPDGVYIGAGSSSRGMERTNPREAERLVDHLVQALRATTPGQRSFGVVTFSMSQQRLIQELLDDRRAQFPEIEPHFQSDEPVFIKNLENVQGDERDEILFSIGYAKDANGKLRMHFGPLSVAGGERRLNVAITRSRCQLRVFSTLTHDQIDLGRTSARGAEHLRAFLHFAAQKGAASLNEPINPGAPGALVEELSATVEELGYQTHTRIGCGGYRIDLAVVDPAQPGRYLLGIECDGPAYGSARSARDRDRIRRDVLTGLGWRLHRVWSSDWTENRTREIQRLRSTLEAASSEPQTNASISVDLMPAPPAPEELGLVNTPGAVPQGFEAAFRPVPTEPSDSPHEPASLPPGGIPYQEALLTALPGEDPEAFYTAVNLPENQARVLAILSLEAPIHRDDLDGKIVRSWGWSALTRRGKVHMDWVLNRLGRDVRAHGAFVWRGDQDPATHGGFRTPGPEGPRDPDRIAPEEIANAMAVILMVNVAMEEGALLKETARLLGYRRITPRTTQALKAGLKPLLQKQGFQQENNFFKHE